MPTTTELLLTTVFLAATPASHAQQPEAPPAIAFAARNLALLREMARYPADCTLLPPGAVDPIRDHLAGGPEPGTLARRAAAAGLAAWPARRSFADPEPVVLHVTPASPGEWEVTGLVIAPDRESIVDQITYRDDGEGGDAAAGDGVFTASFTIPPVWLPDLAGVYAVEVRAEPEDGPALTTRGSFLYGRLAGRLTGRYRDRVEEGSLVIEAEVAVERAARLHLQGTLATADGEPIGWTQVARELDVGKHWLPLTFYGLLFHDRDVAGRFRLASVALATTGEDLPAFDTPDHDVHTTAAYAVETFTTRSFAEPSRVAAAERAARRLGRIQRRQAEGG